MSSDMDFFKNIIPAQMLSIVGSYLDDTSGNVCIKKKLFTITKAYPLFTKDTYPDRIEYRCNGLLHNTNDQPAVDHSNGGKEWYIHGERHRDDDKPAVLMANGVMEWWRNGKYHRDGDKPAVIWKNRQEWFKNGKRHRDNDQPAIIYPRELTEWWYNNKRHRDRGEPAVIERCGTKQWYIHGSFYRKEVN